MIENVLILSCIFVRINWCRNGVLKTRMRFLVLLRCSLNFGQDFVRVKWSRNFRAFRKYDVNHSGIHFDFTYLGFNEHANVILNSIKMTPRKIVIYVTLNQNPDHLEWRFIEMLRTAVYNVFCLDIFTFYRLKKWSRTAGDWTKMIDNIFRTNKQMWLLKLLSSELCDQLSKIKWATTCDFQQCGILTNVDLDEPVQPPYKLRNSKWCAVSSLTLMEYSNDLQRLWSDCAYAQADLRLCWSRIHVPHCWKSHAAAQIIEPIGATLYLSMACVITASTKATLLNTITALVFTWTLFEKGGHWSCWSFWYSLDTSTIRRNVGVRVCT